MVGTLMSVAATIYIQVIRNTCVALAYRGIREKGENADKFERVTEADEVAASKSVARSVVRDGILFGVAVTAVLQYFSEFL